VFRPAVVSVHPKTGEIYVFSWLVENRFHLLQLTEREKKHEPPIPIEPRLVKLGTLDNPKETASYPLPLPKYEGRGYCEWWNLPPVHYAAEVDFESNPPTLWISQATGGRFDGNWQNLGILLLREKGGKMEVVRDFGKEVVKSILRATPPVLDRQRLYVNPKTGKVYVGEGDSGVCKSFMELVEIDPETGKIKLARIPYAAEDIAFDINGLAYLRSDNTVVRYELPSWREIPWDYGEERDNVAFDGGSPKVLSALVTPGHRSPSFWHMGGLYVCPPEPPTRPSSIPAGNAGARSTSGTGTAN
jgi:hypothetical protein